ncbi:hypothetical protein [Paenibacillus sp. MMS18-CY102]|uniref:hypothetical protein n=1 Tax=Paenibacillus sp. MMS18-CY102 TaxID=2682849 RepID=UPI001365E211|nr:hypothetical protein [Paenibacillus sp. MMS18-CY102]MWC27729.1 hypothetical protein [Paenibacillus sp. MMS18-CY102]
MDASVKRYYQLKQKQREIEQELAELRTAIIGYCDEQGLSDWEAGNYRVKVVLQERKEYEDSKLLEALPDLEVWRMLSKPDSARIASLIKLNVITEEKIKDTYSVKKIKLLQVDKR